MLFLYPTLRLSLNSFISGLGGLVPWALVSLVPGGVYHLQNWQSYVLYWISLVLRNPFVCSPCLSVSPSLSPNHSVFRVLRFDHHANQKHPTPAWWW
jgi:hypothetical protein